MIYNGSIHEIQVNDGEYFIEGKKIVPQYMKPVSIDKGDDFIIQYIKMPNFCDKHELYSPSSYYINGCTICEVLGRLPKMAKGIKYVHQMQRLLKDEGYIVVFKTNEISSK